MIEGLCWIDGEIMPASEARISVFDHGFLYGDGIFEGIRFYNKQAFRLENHLKRLKQSAIALQIKLPLNSQELKDALQETINAFSSDQGYCRLIITRGIGELGINPESCQKPSVLFLLSDLQIVNEDQRSNGIKVIIASTRRTMPDRVDPRIKSLNYLNAIMARMEANYAGVEEAIMLNDRGCVAEGTADNVFIVKDNVLLTPPVTEGALDGITRQVVIELASKNKIKYKESVLTPYDLYTADECFLTGTGAKLIPVCEIDGRNIGLLTNGYYQKLSQAFSDLTSNL